MNQAGHISPWEHGCPCGKSSQGLDNLSLGRGKNGKVSPLFLSQKPRVHEDRKQELGPNEPFGEKKDSAK